MPSSDWQQIRPSALNKPTSAYVIYGTVASLTMTGNLNQTKASLYFNTTTSSPKVDTLQTLFGANNMHKTPAERGILSISNDIQDPALSSSFNINKTSARDAIDYSSIAFGEGAAAGVFDNTGGTSVSLCDHCDLLGYSVPNDVAALFQNIINTTVFAAEVVLPLRWRGITAVLVLIGVNTVIMWIIAALYVCRTRFSLAGNYWHAVSQLISKETLSLLNKSSELKDKDLKEQLDLESEDFFVKIGRLPYDGHVTVVRMDE
ncbi:hypothetical protein E0Z10_g8214 [Xylaria hypoxylon]|uniref:Uncharacterized protein n=1 Tax=Xylaria hypoxylon TaxID=37992 RepID=A0A4Z0Y8P5_9PEZI|nr:hypothetical protein E0Z10_g8214 [Xylaria hypoxylon]